MVNKQWYSIWVGVSIIMIACVQDANYGHRVIQASYFEVM